MDWIGTIDVLVKEALKSGDKKAASVKCKDIAGQFGLTVGSIMMYYSVWNNLHRTSLDYIVGWGDLDYSALAQAYSIPMTQEDLVKFDEVEVIRKTAMYPGVWNKTSQSADFQLRVAKKIMQTHLKRRPVGPLNKAVVIECVKYVTQAEQAIAVLDEIKKDCAGSVASQIITVIDSNQISSSCDKLRGRILRGSLDGKLSDSGRFPCMAIKQLHDRLEVIKMMAYKRKEEEQKRREDAKLVTIFVYSSVFVSVLHLDVFVKIMLFLLIL